MVFLVQFLLAIQLKTATTEKWTETNCAKFSSLFGAIHVGHDGENHG
jgi:hypothetical protein